MKHILRKIPIFPAVVALLVLAVHSPWVSAVTPGTVPVFLSKFDTYGIGQGQTEYNADVEISPDGTKLYVPDAQNHRIEVFNTNDNSYVGQFGAFGAGDGQFAYPHDVTTSPDGTKLYVTDLGNHRVQIFNTSDNSYVGQFGTEGCIYNNDVMTNSSLCYPEESAISPDGTKLYVMDADNSRVQVFSAADNSYIATVGAEGSSDGQLSYSLGVTVSPDGTKLYVADTYNRRIQIFNTSDNSFLSKFGTSGAGQGQFNRPDDVVISPYGTKLYVADTSNNRIQIFNTSDNSYVGQFGTPGAGDGQFASPLGITTSPDGTKLYVADTLNSRIQVFQYSSLSTITNPETGKPVLIQTPDTTSLTCSSETAESSLALQDQGYQYPLGFADFCFTTSQLDNEVTLTFVTELRPSQVIARKYNTTTSRFADVPGAVITETTYLNQHALALTYTVADNGPLDLDPQVGSITDPVGLSVAVSASSGYLASTGQNVGLIFVVGLVATSIALRLLRWSKCVRGVLWQHDDR